MTNVLQDKISQTGLNIANLENQKVGGDEVEYTSSKTIHIGGVVNTLTPHRIDPVGRTNTSGIHIQKTGLTPDDNATPHIEQVYTPDLMGDYNLMVANKYNMFVGANGIKQETIGMYEMTGGILTLKGRQVSISSDNEVIIDGGKSLILSGDTVKLAPREREKAGQRYKSIGVEGNIGVNGNAIIKGGVHTEGGITTNSITAPIEYHESEKTLNFSSQRAGLTIGVTSDGKAVTSYAVPDLNVSATTTISAGIPTHFVENNDALREIAMDCNQPEPVLAKPVDEAGNPRGRALRSFNLDYPKYHILDDDCKDVALTTDELLNKIMNGEIAPEEAREMATRASNSPISEINSTEGCGVCG